MTRHGFAAPGTTTPQDLRTRALNELYDLGLAPADTHDRERWNDERRGSVALLARVARWNKTLLITASLMTVARWDDRSVRELLLDAAQECIHHF